jgi:hypothetical protein
MGMKYSIVRLTQLSALFVLQLYLFRIDQIKLTDASEFFKYMKFYTFRLIYHFSFIYFHKNKD